MKKLMFAAAALAAGIAMADGITSANIVGYMNKDTEGCESPSIGATFVPVAGGTTFKLKDIKFTGLSDPDGDVLQLLDPDSTELVATYAYCSPEFAAAAEKAQKKAAGTFDYWIGWWEVGDGFDPDDDDLRRDEEEINVGQGFLGLMSDQLELVSSGSVPLTTSALATDGCESPFLANYLPREIKLGWITTEDISDPDGDVLQLLDPDSTELVATYAYCSPAFAAAAEKAQKKAAGTFDYWIGWWEVGDGFDPDDDDLRRDEELVAPGQAFLGLMSDDITYLLPSALYQGE